MIWGGGVFEKSESLNESGGGLYSHAGLSRQIKPLGNLSFAGSITAGMLDAWC